MRRRSRFVLALTCVILLLTGCDSKSAPGENKSAKGHEAITMLSAFPGMSEFVDLLSEKYPEINLEIIPYSGKNMTAYLKEQMTSGEMPDIYVTTVYSPGQQDLSDCLIDLSGYAFTNNYAESQLRNVSDNGALYLLPTYYSCLGITYNKTLLEKNGWTLPTSFAELEELAPKVREAGYNLAIDQITLPGYGFQYFCNIMDTTFLNTLDGRKWQNDFLSGKTTMRDTSELVEALSTLEKWKEIGMLNGDSDLKDDGITKAMMAEGNTLFLLGGTNNFTKEDSEDEFGLMPYLSKDGKQNSLILNVGRYVGLNKHLEDAGNERKLEDAIHVMEVLSTVEGMSTLATGFENSTLLPLQDYVIPETNYYKQVEDELNAGLTAPFIYAGWDNIIVPTGNTMLEYIKGNATLDDVISAFDDNQNLLVDNSSTAYTKVTESMDRDDCAKLVGICFGKASHADLALISKNKWYPVSGGYNALNVDGVSGSLMALPVTDQEITAFLPTGWHDNIQTVTLTGKRVKELAESGYERKGMTFPYELVMPEGMTIKDETVYTVVICGVSEAVAKEGNLTDTGILGLTAMQEYLSQFETFSKADLQWE
ncbi:ABC transporter substrate-binding protein [Brotaphodocola sp.]|uniref:ABC transporter substrate-binding protein n=1 Tax=Brotaphodocola sp. TaxID=3073577 RepID=UPI003D7E77E4